MAAGPARVTRRALLAGAGAALLPAAARSDTLDMAETRDMEQASRDLLFGTRDRFDAALAFLRARGQVDAAAVMILALRYRVVWRDGLVAALRDLTGHDAPDWFAWMVWQELHPDAVPHPSFTAVKLAVLSGLDRRFPEFFRAPWHERTRMAIRLEEITWGGVGAMTGIPSLDNPKMIAAGDAGYLRDDDLVFGAAIAGDARAYPLRILGWHEMMNDTVGGVPVALAYCTLCGSGILYETRVPGRAAPLVFGSSGLLYRSNKLMFDWATKSLWTHYTGRPAVGPLTGAGIELGTRPLVTTDWAGWRRRHPATTVLSRGTGHHRDYRSGAAYADYFADPGLMFPAARADGNGGPAPKDHVFGIVRFAAARAWPLAAFRRHRVINDTVGDLPVVLVGDAATRTVRAYERGDRDFAWENGALRGPGGAWTVTEAELVGPGGTRLPRVAGRLSFWFAWNGYHGLRGELYRPRP